MHFFVTYIRHASYEHLLYNTYIVWYVCHFVRVYVAVG
jgi:hypothetical protein